MTTTNEPEASAHKMHMDLIATKSRLYDPNDEVRTHEGKEGEEALKMVIKRLTLWVDKQPEEVQGLFCRHGQYTGYQQALAYYCPLCVPRNEA